METAVQVPQKAGYDFVEMVIKESGASAEAPATLKERVQFSLRKALDDLHRFGESLARVIAKLHQDSPYSQRYLILPDEQALLFLDKKGHLIKVKEPTLLYVAPAPGEPATDELIGFESAEFLTGDHAGKTLAFRDSDVDLYKPEYKEGVVGSWLAKNPFSGASFPS